MGAATITPSSLSLDTLKSIVLVWVVTCFDRKHSLFPEKTVLLMLRIFKRQRWLRLMLILLIVTIGSSELADWVACNVVTNSPDLLSCGVLVLGYPSNEDGTPSPVQAVRVETGLKVYRNNRCDRLVFSGAAVKNHIVEAQTMAGLADGSGVQPDREARHQGGGIVLETQARNTWENIKFSIPFLEKYDRIFIASDGLHSQRGRRYLCKQRPDLCDRTFVGVEYRPFERLWWKVGSAGYELSAWGRDFLNF
jgi:DUF218 domain